MKKVIGFGSETVVVEVKWVVAVVAAAHGASCSS